VAYGAKFNRLTKEATSSMAPPNPESFTRHRRETEGGKVGYIHPATLPVLVSQVARHEKAPSASQATDACLNSGERSELLSRAGYLCLNLSY